MEFVSENNSNQQKKSRKQFVAVIFSRTIFGWGGVNCAQTCLPQNLPSYRIFQAFLSLFLLKPKQASCNVCTPPLDGNIQHGQSAPSPPERANRRTAAFSSGIPAWGNWEQQAMLLRAARPFCSQGTTCLSPPVPSQAPEGPKPRPIRGQAFQAE